MTVLRNVKKVEITYKYYSFLCGIDNLNLSLYDLKLPANDPKHAVRMYTLLTKNNPKKNLINFEYTPTLLFKIIEYERVRNISGNIVQFKKVKEIFVNW